MADEVGSATDAPAVPPPKVVGQAFCTLYYNILHKRPRLMRKFYTALSSLTWAEADSNGAADTATSQSEIQHMVDNLDLGHVKTEINSIESQHSVQGAVFLVVTGTHCKKAIRSRRAFTQSFLLVPREAQEGVAAYDVLNDVFRYLEREESPMDLEAASEVLVALQSSQASTQSEPTSPSQTSSELEVPVPKQATTEPQPPLPSEAYTEPPPLPTSPRQSSSEPDPSLRTLGRRVDSATSKAELEISESSPAANSNDRTREEEASTSGSSHRSYKSVLTMGKERTLPVPSVTASPQLPCPLDGPDFEAGGFIYVKNLPFGTSSSQLEAELEKFGRIRPGGIDLKGYAKGICYAFVDFDEHISAQSAVDASPITVGGQQAFIEWNRSLGFNSKVVAKNLLPSTSIAKLSAEFGKFGLILDRGVRLSFPAAGVCHALIEFKDYTSARAAVASSPLIIYGRRVFIEENMAKKSNWRPSGHQYGIQMTTPVDATAGPTLSDDQLSDLSDLLLETDLMSDQNSSSDKLSASTKKPTAMCAARDGHSSDHSSAATKELQTPPTSPRAGHSSDHQLKIDKSVAMGPRDGLRSGKKSRRKKGKQTVKEMV